MKNEMLNKIYSGDALTILKGFPDGSIDCVISSPPYWGLRDYNVSGQLGLENTFEEYIKKLCDIFDEVKRVLKKEGTCFVNIGDSYLGSNQGYGQKEGQGSGLQNTSDGYFASSNNKPALSKYKSQAKSLALIPFRFAIEMVNRGWILRNDCVWYKRNSMPSSVEDRFSNKWEHIFFFVKSKKYYFDLDVIRKPYNPVSLERFKRNITGASAFNYRVREAIKGTLQSKFGDKYSATEEEKTKYHNNMTLEQAEALGSPRAREMRNRRKSNNPELNNRNFMSTNKQDLIGEKTYTGFNERYKNNGLNPLGGNPGDFFDITTKSHSFAHFAVYPERLCETPIKAGCPEDGIVLDPFAGSGTTCLVAKRLGRNFIGFELNPKYIEIANKRLSETEKPLIAYT